VKPFPTSTSWLSNSAWLQYKSTQSNTTSWGEISNVNIISSVGVSHLEKESIWFVCIFWTLVLSCCQPTFPLESGPFEIFFQIFNVTGKWHWAVFTQTPFSHFWRFHVWFGYWLFFETCKQCFFFFVVTNFLNLGAFSFRKWKKIMNILPFSWRVFAIFWLKKFKLATSRPRHFLGCHL
jgi:hypothetical protein